jgi:hypothetical protein
LSATRSGCGGHRPLVVVSTELRGEIIDVFQGRLPTPNASLLG